MAGFLNHGVYRRGAPFSVPSSALYQGREYLYLLRAVPFLWSTASTVIKCVTNSPDLIVYIVDRVDVMINERLFVFRDTRLLFCGSVTST
jgi:hypothetical protein